MKTLTVILLTFSLAGCSALKQVADYNENIQKPKPVEIYREDLLLGAASYTFDEEAKDITNKIVQLQMYINSSDGGFTIKHLSPIELESLYALVANGDSHISTEEAWMRYLLKLEELRRLNGKEKNILSNLVTETTEQKPTLVSPPLNPQQPQNPNGDLRNDESSQLK